MSDVMLSLVAAECKHAVEQCGSGLEEKMRASMEKAKDHWMVLDKDMQMRGAIAAVMMHYGQGTPEYERIEKELGQLRAFSAFFAAAQAGLNVSPPEIAEDDVKPIGLLGMWREVSA